jgi:hypothetical protein
MLKAPTFHYIDVKSNEQCQRVSPSPDIIIKQQFSPSPFL